MGASFCLPLPLPLAPLPALLLVSLAMELPWLSDFTKEGKHGQKRRKRTSL